MNFVQERVKELQVDLESLFQSLSSNSVKENVFRLLRRPTVFQMGLTSPQTSSDTSLDNGNLLIGTERAEVLRKAIDSIQLDKSDIPKMNVILNQLNMVEQSLHGNWKTATNEASFPENEELERGIIHLEWLFLAKLTISVYGKILENLLISTLPLSDDIHYWGELEGSKLWSLIHLFQTSPFRICSLSGAIFNTICRQFQDVSSLHY
ncbi:NCA2-domain-containing protein [Rhizophagus clarus]|uniref:NCA2-domain-containing protein n=1 Tax=Rhizophagus clarus TaxID=94130 RepID=A0A8H3QGB0_9GLOM|nr:NCA2-domain-containing protein [Rhizophagus clarus]